MTLNGTLLRRCYSLYIVVCSEQSDSPTAIGRFTPTNCTSLTLTTLPPSHFYHINSNKVQKMNHTNAMLGFLCDAAEEASPITSSSDEVAGQPRVAASAGKGSATTTTATTTATKNHRKSNHNILLIHPLPIFPSMSLR